MNSVELLLDMGEIGWRFMRKDIAPMMNYFDKMLADRRIVSIVKDGYFVAIMAFSLCFDYKPFLEKKEWEYKEHDAKGDILYVEKLVSLYWNKQMRYDFEEIITHFYPAIKFGIWHRMASFGDRKVIYKRRLQNV
jgi:hypothetical protein